MAIREYTAMYLVSRVGLNEGINGVGLSQTVFPRDKMYETLGNILLDFLAFSYQVAGDSLVV